MKKKYAHPVTRVIHVRRISILSDSYYGITSTKGLRYGGVDVNDDYEVE